MTIVLHGGSTNFANFLMFHNTYICLLLDYSVIKDSRCFHLLFLVYWRRFMQSFMSHSTEELLLVTLTHGSWFYLAMFSESNLLADNSYLGILIWKNANNISPPVLFWLLVICGVYHLITQQKRACYLRFNEFKTKINFDFYTTYLLRDQLRIL